MSHKVTTEEAAGHFSELVERVRKEHEIFVIVSDGEEICQLSPVTLEQPAATLTSFFELLKNIRPDEAFARDLEEIQAAQTPIGDGPWDS